MRHRIKLEFEVESGVESNATLASLYRIIVREEIPGVESVVDVNIDDEPIG